MQASPTPVETVPLTGWQKARLLYDCIPFMFFIVMVAIYLVVAPAIIDGPMPPLMIVFIAVVLGVLGFQAVQRVRDLLSGVAAVREDRLLRSWRSRAGSAKFYARFEGLGQIRIIQSARARAANNQRYRVIYSPISRIVWDIQPIN